MRKLGFNKPYGVDLASRQLLPGSCGQRAQATNGPPWARRGLCPGMQAGERALGGLVPPPPNSRATHSPLEGLSQRLRAMGMSRAEYQLPLAGPCPECLLPPAGSEEISKAREPSRHRRPLQAPTHALGSVWLGTTVPTRWPL